MQTNEFTAEETEVMREVLQSGLKEIGLEVSRADSIDFKHVLKHRREILEHVLSKLMAAPVAGPMTR